MTGKNQVSSNLEEVVMFCEINKNLFQWKILIYIRDQRSLVASVL